RATCLSPFRAKSYSLAGGALLLGRHLERALRLGHRDQGWIKLHERLVDSGVLGMAFLTDRVGRQGLGGRLGSVEAEERPFGGRESFLVFQVNLEPGQSILKTASLVDRCLARREANFERHHGLVGPGTG